MSQLKKIRAITLLSIPAAALAVLFTLQPSADRGQLPGPRESLALCATTKGALCDGIRNEVNPRDAFRPAAVADLGAMTVVARRIPDVQAASTVEEIAFLGSMTITASRLPTAKLAKAKPEASTRKS